MSVDGIVHDIDLSPDEPLVERLLRVIEHPVPFLKPHELFSLRGPEGLWVATVGVRERVPVLEAGCLLHCVGGVENLTLQFLWLAFGLDRGSAIPLDRRLTRLTHHNLLRSYPARRD